MNNCDLASKVRDELQIVRRNYCNSFVKNSNFFITVSSLSCFVVSNN